MDTNEVSIYYTHFVNKNSLTKYHDDNLLWCKKKLEEVNSLDETILVQAKSEKGNGNENENEESKRKTRQVIIESISIIALFNPYLFLYT